MCEVRMMPVASLPWVFDPIPINASACATIQHFFMDEKSADVVFEVEDDDDDDDDHSPPTKFYAHSLILKNASSLLAACTASQEMINHRVSFRSLMYLQIPLDTCCCIFMDVNARISDEKIAMVMILIRD